MSELKEVLSRVVAPNFGLLTYVSEVQLQTVEPDIYIAVAEFQDPRLVSAHTRDLPPSANDNRQASGAGLDRESTLWSTVGEAVERYASSIIDVDNLIYDTYDNLGAEAMDPREMILFDDWQYEKPDFPYVRVDTAKPFGWVKGFNLTANKPAYIPARFVYLDYLARYPNELIDNGYSTGLAAGPDHASAVYTGIRELIERDAFSCYWLTGITPPKVELEPYMDALPPALQNILRVEHIDYNLRNITTEFDLPCMLSLLKSGDKLGFSTGTSCHPNPGLALEKAVVESFHTFNWVLDINRWQEPAADPKELRSFADHVAYYLDPSRHGALDFLYADAPTKTMPIKRSDFDAGFANKQELAELVSYLKKFGLEVFVADLTTEDIADLGFSVVKVVIPGLQPLYCGHQNQHCDPRRMKKFAKNMGYDFPQQLNLAPHAFP